ncbi:MAG: hypothetical protein QUV05_02895 [Phycisphaerae bacterium]|nr:hypothetical protein [Phycisphaerae bacterium]
MNHDSDRCFRLERRFLHIGVVCTIFFFLFGVGSSAAALWNVDGSFGRPRETALVFGVFWACFTGLGIGLILRSVRSRLYIGPRSVRELGVFRVRAMCFDGLSAARWRVFLRGGSLVLRGRDGKLTLDFASFSPADRREMIELLRNRIDERIQEDWARFESRILVPLIRTLNQPDASETGTAP